MKKLRAFTIMEMVIAMLIAAIVIGMTYAVYTIVVRSCRSFDDRHRQMAALLQLNKLLKKDIEEADLVSRTDTDLITLKRADQTLTYRIRSGWIVRVGVEADTFKMAV